MKTLLGVSTALFVLVGCGSNFCERQRDLYEQKTRNCPGLASMTTDQFVEECEAGIGTCNGDDLSGLDRGLQCVETLDDCVDDGGFSQVTWAIQAGACFANRGIREECGAI